jgi:hypothetical protein
VCPFDHAYWCPLFVVIHSRSLCSLVYEVTPVFGQLFTTLVATLCTASLQQTDLLLRCGAQPPLNTLTRTRLQHVLSSADFDAMDCNQVSTVLLLQATPEAGIRRSNTMYLFRFAVRSRRQRHSSPPLLPLQTILSPPRHQSCNHGAQRRRSLRPPPWHLLPPRPQLPSSAHRQVPP